MPVLLPGQPISSRRTVFQPIAVGGGGGAFSPADLGANLYAWYRADEIVGKVEGDPISQWDDLSGNARHLTQATSSKQPVYKASTINSLPGVRTDGVDDWMTHLAGAAFATASTLTLALVYRRVSVTLNFARGLSLVGSGASEDWDNTGSMTLDQGANAGSPGDERVDRNSAVPVTQSPHPGNLVGMAMLIWFDGTNANQRINGAASSTPSGASAGSFNVDRILLGAGWSGSAPGAVPSNYDFCEVILAAGLTSGERTDLEDYCLTEYAL